MYILRTIYYFLILILLLLNRCNIVESSVNQSCQKHLPLLICVPCFELIKIVHNSCSSRSTLEMWKSQKLLAELICIIDEILFSDYYFQSINQILFLSPALFIIRNKLIRRKGSFTRKKKKRFITLDEIQVW